MPAPEPGGRGGAAEAPGERSTAPPVLSVEGLRTGYGALEAVLDVSLEVGPGEIVTVLGHNGAGKTTTLRAVMGLQPVWDGTIRFDGRDVTGDAPAENVGRGLCFVPEDRFVFPGLDVAEHLAVAGQGVPDGAAAERRAEVFELLPILADRRTQDAATLSGGEKRMLSVAMAMMAGPRLLLLDEPSLGLAPVLVEKVLELVARLAREKSLAVLMVEQNVDQALHVAERAYVMRAGRTILEESAEEMRAREQWWDLY